MAVFPELHTTIRPASPGQAVEPPPPDDLYFLYFDKAILPARTRDGQPWLPDSYAVLTVSGQDILRTPIQPAERRPTWQGQKLANYRITDDEQVLLEVWDADTIRDEPICHEKLVDLKEMRAEGGGEITCDSGARIWLHVEPARALVGLGLYYELRGSDGVRVTRVMGQSPASRAGLQHGDRILAIQGEPVMQMDALQVKSRMNMHARSGVELDVWFQSGERRKISLTEGAMYPLYEDELELPQTRSQP